MLRRCSSQTGMAVDLMESAETVSRFDDTLDTASQSQLAYSKRRLYMYFATTRSWLASDHR